MNLSVLGAGELGTACALALIANNSSHHVSLLSRDSNVAMTINQKGSLMYNIFNQKSLRLPPQLKVENYYTRTQLMPCRVIFVCTPPVALTWTGSFPVGVEITSKGDSIAPQAGPVLSHLFNWYDQLLGVQHDAKDVLPFLVVFSRGLNAEGVTPVDLAYRAVNAGRGSARKEISQCVSKSRVPLVLSATGPIFAREWAAQSSQLSPTTVAGSITKQTITSASSTTTAPVDGLHQAEHKSFSGTALVFAVNNPRPDSGIVSALRKCLQQDLFNRESVTLLDAPDSGAIVKLFNACLPLCAFGAGLVSNCYPGSNASALAAYAHHALTATETLINRVLHRLPHTPLPACLWPTLFSVCNHYSLREFVLGRQFDFHFKKTSALQAVYSGKSHADFSSSLDGFHTLMKSHSVSSPFYEAIMDTFNTSLRASEVGLGLVKEGYYAYREPRPSPFVDNVMKMDEAVFSGDEDAFKVAKSRFLDTLS